MKSILKLPLAGCLRIAANAAYLCRANPQLGFIIAHRYSSASNGSKPNVSGSLPPAYANRVQQVINRAMLETELSEGEIIRYLEYWLKGKQIEKRGGNDR